jgi:hypothetical protein
VCTSRVYDVKIHGKIAATWILLAAANACQEQTPLKHNRPPKSSSLQGTWCIRGIVLTRQLRQQMILRQAEDIQEKLNICKTNCYMSVMIWHLVRRPTCIRRSCPSQTACRQYVMLTYVEMASTYDLLFKRLQLRSQLFGNQGLGLREDDIITFSTHTSMNIMITTYFFPGGPRRGIWTQKVNTNHFCKGARSAGQVSCKVAPRNEHESLPFFAFRLHPVVAFTYSRIHPFLIAGKKKSTMK